MMWGLVNILMVFGGVAFFTLLERKILSYSQNRKGPNKISFLGILQPVSDAVKLIIKFFGGLLEVKLIEFFLFPLLSLLMMVSFWLVIYPSFSFFNISLGILILFTLFSLSVFPVLGSGWASKSKYSILGALRGAAQSISYEVILIFILIWSILFFKEMGFFFNSQIFLGLIFFFIFFIWFMVMVCETNRAPFDFAEGESELVSGFNVEYGSFPFALLFLAEYGVILFLSMLTGIYFFSGIFSVVIGWFISICFLWVRSSFPRFRYDLLMILCWGMFLPLTFMMFFFMKFL